MYRGFNDGWAHGAYTFGFPWGAIVMGIFILALIALVIFLAMRTRKLQAPILNDSIDRGIDILIDRYTRGEIDADKFREMKEVLDGKTKGAR
jgi:uncharacterized membrane protein